MKFPIANAVCSSLLALLVATSASAAEETAQKLSYSNKWRMECSGKAHSAGTIVVRVTPKGGESITAEVAIADKTGENDVAKALVKGLKAQLPKDYYHIERDDGEDVLVKKKMGKDNFALELVSSDVEHVRIHIEKE